MQAQPEPDYLISIRATNKPGLLQNPSLISAGESVLRLAKRCLVPTCYSASFAFAFSKTTNGLILRAFRKIASLSA